MNQLVLGNVITIVVAVINAGVVLHEFSRYRKVKRLEQRVASLRELREAVTEFYRIQYHYGIKKATGDSTPELDSGKAAYDIAIMKMDSLVKVYNNAEMNKVFARCFYTPGGAEITNVPSFPLSGPVHLFVKDMYRLIAKKLLSL